MNLNPYEPNEIKSQATAATRNSGSGYAILVLALFLSLFGSSILIINYVLNQRMNSGVGMPRRYASYRVEFEPPVSITQSRTLAIVALGLSALAITIALVKLRSRFKKAN